MVHTFESQPAELEASKPSSQAEVFSKYALPSKSENVAIAYGVNESSRSAVDNMFGAVTLEDRSTLLNNRNELLAKLPWEHPSSPEDAANRAMQAIQTMGGNPLAYEEAARWLNDGTNDFKTRAANSFNALQIHVVSPTTRERCLVQAQKRNGEVSVREVSCE